MQKCSAPHLHLGQPALSLKGRKKSMLHANFKGRELPGHIILQMLAKEPSGQNFMKEWHASKKLLCSCAKRTPENQ
jgi:hypothetical protein